MKYTLTKKILNADKTSAVAQGHVTTGDYLFLFDYRTGKSFPIKDVFEVIPEKQVVCGNGMFSYHNTSMIKSVRIIDPNTIEFETQTSVYELKQEE